MTQPESSRASLTVHRCRFVEYIPGAINALSFNPVTFMHERRLAVARAQGPIEIWCGDSRDRQWRCEKVLPCRAPALESDQITPVTEALVWLENDRLFTANVEGLLEEWNVETLQVTRSLHSLGGAIWCMAANRDASLLAVGCEDGCVRLYHLTEWEEDCSSSDDEDSQQKAVPTPTKRPVLSFAKSLERQEGRILSLSWHPRQSAIVAGYDNGRIAVFDTLSGKLMHSMTVDSQPERPTTFVWSVAFLAHHTIVSGDSLGHVQFWDARTGTLIQSMTTHGADVLCLVANKAGDKVYASGVDHKVVELSLLTRTATNDQETTVALGQKSSALQSSIDVAMKRKWIVTGQRRLHGNDVRCMALFESEMDLSAIPVSTDGKRHKKEKLPHALGQNGHAASLLVSGGVDSKLIFHNTQHFPKYAEYIALPYPTQPVVHLASEAQCLLAQTTPNTLQLWRLAPLGQVKPDQSQFSVSHESLVSIELARPFHPVLCRAVSSNAEWVAVSTSVGLKIFHYHVTEHQPRIKKALHLPQDLIGSPIVQMQFAPDHCRLVVAGTCGKVQLLELDLDEDERPVVRCLALFEQRKKPVLAVPASLSISSDGQWLAVGDYVNQIHVFNMDTCQWHCSLPVFETMHTLISFHVYQPQWLIVVTRSNVFYVYNVEQRRLTDWSRAHLKPQQFPKRWIERQDRVLGVTYRASKPNTITLWGLGFLCQVDLTWSHSLKRSSSDSTLTTPVTASNSTTNDGFSWCLNYQPLLLAQFIQNNDSLVVVERPLLDIVAAQPPAFYRARFGAT